MEVRNVLVFENVMFFLSVFLMTLMYIKGDVMGNMECP